MDKKDLIKSEEKFSFEIQGDECIDAAKLSYILQNTVDIVNGTVQGKEDTYVNLKVTKFSTGSFDIDFKAIAEQVNNLIAIPENLAALIVAGVSGVFKLTKHLKGDTPKSITQDGENSIIENRDGQVMSLNHSVCNQFFKDAKIENSVINIINTVGESGRDGFSIKHGSDEVIYSRVDIDNVKPVVSKILKEKEGCLVNKINATLIIRKPDLVGKSKWGFVFDKNIEATIEDEEWLDKIHKEKTKFCLGMKLPVVMSVELPIDENQNPAGDPVYKILKVTGAIIEDEVNQLEINL